MSHKVTPGSGKVEAPSEGMERGRKPRMNRELGEKLDNQQCCGCGERLSQLKGALDDVLVRVSQLEERYKESVESVSQLLNNREEYGKLVEGRIDHIEKTIQELSDRLTAFELHVKEEWPKPGAEWTTVVNKPRKNESTNVKKMTFGERYKDKASVVLLGDSLVRGVGQRLQSQNSDMFTSVSKSGAKIEDMVEEVGKLKDNDKRHLVVMVGTNDIKREGSESVKKKYDKLISKCKSVKNRAVTLVGIPMRVDVNGFVNSRRLGVNKYLKRVCEQNQVQYLELEEKRHVLAQDGLHFNWLGQGVVAHRIFGHCKSFLV